MALPATCLRRPPELFGFAGDAPVCSPSRRTLISAAARRPHLCLPDDHGAPEYGLDVVGFLDGDSPDPLPAPMRGSRGEVARLVEEYEIDRVLIGVLGGGPREILDVVRTVRRPDAQVSIFPRRFEIFTSYATLEDAEGI